MAVMNVQKLPPRIIDPKDPLGKQTEVLNSLIHNPPENSRILTFSPGLAEWILTELNDRNRSMRPARIRRFAEAMASDNWRLTGDTIKFERSGVLVDGQNRLAACVHSNVKFRTHVVFGVETKAFAVMDTGAVRTGIDTFKIEGVPNHRIVAPAVRWITIYAANATDPDRGMSIDNARLLELYKTKINKDRLRIATDGAIASGKVMQPHGPLAALLYRFLERDMRTAQRFIDDLASGEKGAKKLRVYLVELRKQQNGRMDERQFHACIINAFNCYRRGEMVTQRALSWHLGKDFPVLV